LAAEQERLKKIEDDKKKQEAAELERLRLLEEEKKKKEAEEAKKKEDGANDEF
jgi:hypothetical protein